MTYAQALMIVRNANEEDCLDAGSALGYADMMNVKATFAPGARCGDMDDHPFSGAIGAGGY